MTEPTGDEFESDRTFQMWKYRVGHKTLLLRSVKSEPISTRIDVLFVAVDRLELPTLMHRLVIHSEDREFQLRGDGWAGLVIAGAMAHEEDKGEYFDPSPFAAGAGISRCAVS
jgi:hypothetical protein